MQKCKIRVIKLPKITSGIAKIQIQINIHKATYFLLHHADSQADQNNVN